MYYLVLLLLVGTIYADEPDFSNELNSLPSQENEWELPTSSQENDCDKAPSSQEEECDMPPSSQEEAWDMPGSLDGASLRHCNIEKCNNFTTIEITEGAEQFCPGKSTCTLRVFNCPNTFAGAEHACRCHRGRLVSIHHQCRNNRVRCIASSVLGNCRWAWIGVSRNPCGYRNSDGSRFDYSNFAGGQRRNCGTWCVAMHTGNGLWYSHNCGIRVPYVCAF